MALWVKSRNFRRSIISANAPAGSAISSTGRVTATVTSATHIGELVREVMSQPVATACIQLPVYEMTAAIHKLRNSGSRKGESAEKWAGARCAEAGFTMGLAGLEGKTADM